MQPIYTQTMAGTGGSISFNNIPQTFTDLKLVGSARGTNSALSITAVLYLNGDTSLGSFTYLYGNGSATGSSRASGYIDGVIIPSATSTASTFGNFELYIPNYTSSNFKSIISDAVGENNATAADQGLRSILWRSTSAITQIGFNLGAGNFAANSTFTIYGITKG